MTSVLQQEVDEQPYGVRSEVFQARYSVQPIAKSRCLGKNILNISPIKSHVDGAQFFHPVGNPAAGQLGMTNQTSNDTLLCGNCLLPQPQLQLPLKKGAMPSAWMYMLNKVF